MIVRKCPAVAAAILALLSQQAVAASCDSANLFSFSFASQPAATLAYGSTYIYTATNSNGATQAFSILIAQNGMTSTLAGGAQMPNISTLVTGPDATLRDLVVGGVFGARTASMAGTTRLASVTFTFPTPIHNFSLTAHDVDFGANQFRDWVQVTAIAGSTYTPVLTTPWGTGNNGLPTTSASSSLTVGPTTSPLSLSVSQLAGTATSGNNSDTGTFTANFAQPVTNVAFKYGNYPLTGTETTTGQQAIGIAGISFCAMPIISLTKSSTPAIGALGAFNLPDNDVIYTITVTNSGASSADGNSIVISDALPANTTFRNAAVDGTTVLPIKLTGPAGISLSSANVTYRKTGTSTFNYTPAAGYDPQVAEVRIVPGGELGANSSFSVQFVAKVN
jgi:uncharacterized repeat protein (TIGR01451 family)